MQSIPKEFFDIFNIGFILFTGWMVFSYFSRRKATFLQEYKRLTITFFLSAVSLFILYFSQLKQYFLAFSFTPFIILFLFYLAMILTYRYVRLHLNQQLVKKFEKHKFYLASISYRYLTYKSFDILFQQICILCIITFLKDLSIPYLFLMILFAGSFASSHLYLLKREATIGSIFLVGSFIGGLIFPLIITMQYGIVYTYMLHWLFYILLGVLIHRSSKLDKVFSLQK